MNKIAVGALALGLVVAMAGFAGCQSTPPPSLAGESEHSDITLRAGDVLHIEFPGAPNLDTSEPIRRDGKITVGLAGEVQAAGLTPTELQNALLAKIGDQLLTKEVLVTVTSSQFVVYVDGPVLRPGKIVTDHPLTALEAIMEAGGFDYEKADPKDVTLIRHKQGSKDYAYYTLNLQNVLDGKQKDLFYLQTGDILHVPEKFSWF
ncbi:MAG: polysaccharide biosynthesis/export family protein [Opitutaceae bacterium]